MIANIVNSRGWETGVQRPGSCPFFVGSRLSPSLITKYNTYNNVVKVLHISPASSHLGKTVSGLQFSLSVFLSPGSPHHCLSPFLPIPPHNGPYLQTGCGYSRVRLISKVRMSVIENGIKDLRLHERFLIISFSPFTFR